MAALPNTVAIRDLRSANYHEPVPFGKAGKTNGQQHMALPVEVVYWTQSDKF